MATIKIFAYGLKVKLTHSSGSTSFIILDTGSQAFHILDTVNASLAPLQRATKALLTYHKGQRRALEDQYPGLVWVVPSPEIVPASQIRDFRFRYGLFGRQVLEVCVESQDHDWNTGSLGPKRLVWRDATSAEACELSQKLAYLSHGYGG